MTTAIDIVKFTRGMCAKKGEFNTIEAAKYGELCKECECYEVIPDDRPVKLYFDIDIKGDADEYDGQIKWCEDIIVWAEQGITEIVKKYMNFDIEPDFVVATSNSERVKDWKKEKEYWKLSIHIIVNNVVCMKKYQEEIAKALNRYMTDKSTRCTKKGYEAKIAEELETNIVGKDEKGKTNKLFDEGIYDNARKLRSVYVSKPNENRPLELVKGTFEKSIISACFPPDVVEYKPPVEVVEKKPTIVAKKDADNDNYNRMKFIDLLEAGLFDDRAQEYTTWLQMGFALLNEFGKEDGWELFDAFSQRSSTKYDREKNEETWDKLTTSLQGEKLLKFGSIVKWARDNDRATADAIIKEIDAIRNKKYKENIRNQHREEKNNSKKEEFEEIKKQFEKQVEEFEKNHLLIVNRSCYLKQTIDDNIFMTRDKLKTSYEHLSGGYRIISEEKGTFKPIPFVEGWTKDNPNIRKADDVGIYPPPLQAPQNIFNLWRPFKIDLYEGEFTPNERAKELILRHIHILCNNDQKVADYMIKWIAHLLKYPANKSVLITFISSQGAGKGTLIKLISKLIGDNRVLETTNPARDVWGDFNGMMANKFVVVLNELSMKDTTDCEGKIKGLITDPTLTINPKGTAQYEIHSYHRFIITTNNEYPSKTSVDDRRQVFIRSSDELCIAIENNQKKKEKLIEYFKELHDLLDDENVIRTMGEYFKGIDVSPNFNNEKMPITEYHSDLIEASKSIYELFFIHFITTFQNEKTVAKYSNEIYADFLEFCRLNGFNCEINNQKTVNSQRLGVRMKNLLPTTERDKFIQTEKSGNNRRKVFHIQELKKHFKIE